MKKIICKKEYDTELSEVVEKRTFGSFGDADGYGYLHAPLHLLAYGIDHPGLRWLAQNYSRQNAESLLRLRTYENVYDMPAYPPEITSACYDRVGWAIFRDGWDKDGTMLAVKCGDTWNHAHADAGADGAIYSHDIFVGQYVVFNDAYLQKLEAAQRIKLICGNDGSNYSTFYHDILRFSS